MSLIKKMFGLRTFDEIKQSADKLYEAGDFGAAKIEYERAKERGRQAGDEARDHVLARIDACRDELAQKRIDKALDFLRMDQLALAISELENAIEIAASDELIQRANKMIEDAERDETQEEPIAQESQTDEERYAILAGSWEDEQAEEYENYGPDFVAALLALDDNQVPQAREKLEDLLQQAKDPHYLYFEVGKVRLLDGDLEKGAEAMSQFLTRIGPDEGGGMRLAAHTELARLAKDANDFEGAVAQLQAAIEAMPKDPRPYLAMGNFLRQQGHLDEAVDVLESGLNMMVASDVNPEWRLIQELGLTFADLENPPKAIDYLEQVVEILVARHHLDLPPESAIRLAELHERSGNKARAADLFSILAHGSDTGNYFLYYKESGRLLAEIGVNAEARRALKRAIEFAPDDEQIKESLRSQIEALENA